MREANMHKNNKEDKEKSRWTAFHGQTCFDELEEVAMMNSFRLVTNSMD